MRKMRVIMKKYYRTHFLGVELAISFMITILIYLVIELSVGTCVLELKLAGLRNSLYGTLASISGALLGFVITGLSILLTNGSNAGMNRLKKSRHYKTVFTIFFSTSKYLGILFISSMISFVLDTDSEPNFLPFLITLWALIISAFRILRCLWVLEKIIMINIVHN